MIKFENVETFGWEATIRGMGNPIHSIESQVVMDNVYVVERCSLDAPSLGECTLAGKKNTMWHIQHGSQSIIAAVSLVAVVMVSAMLVHIFKAYKRRRVIKEDHNRYERIISSQYKRSEMES